MDDDATAIRRIRYDRTRAKLLVGFANGERYVYGGVPRDVCRAFRAAAAKGLFFQTEIADRYPFNRLA